MQFAAHNPLRTVSQNSLAKWDAVSACGPVGKPHPTPIANSGSHFPPRPSTGNGIPFLGRKLGCGFHRAPQRETASHSKGKFRDAASATPPIRKSHPTPHTSGHRTISLLGLPSIKGRPRVTKKASRTSRLSHLYCFARRTTNGEATLPARPSWRLQPCCPGLPWWDGPLRQPSCRAAS